MTSMIRHCADCEAVIAGEAISQFRYHANY